VGVESVVNGSAGPGVRTAASDSGLVRSVQAQATASGERLAIGEWLSGRYRIERELGEGGMGVVYLVTDKQVAGEIFAVKVLKQGLDPEALSLLREEVRKAATRRHCGTESVVADVVARRPGSRRRWT
jgi:non-specific serine/threonine protein kinase